MTDEEILDTIGTATMMSVTRDVLLDLTRRVREDEREKCEVAAGKIEGNTADAPAGYSSDSAWAWACGVDAGIEQAKQAIRARKD